jgi:hypothetical protein
MLWDDPWIAVATTAEGTRLPPAAPVWPAGVTFMCVQANDLDLAAWSAFVGTGWEVAELAIRLEGAWIPVLQRAGEIMGTCVLRPKEDGLWILETLKAAKGFGALTMRSSLRWIWDTHGPCTLGFTWELTGRQLIGAWWRGWGRAIAAVQWGWMWVEPGTPCGFCGGGDAVPKEYLPRYVRPVFVEGAVVNDSGARDGWGHVCAWTPGDVDWAAVAKIGGWKRLWARSERSPGPGWRWTGEVVVVGMLNRRGLPVTQWITAEI